MVRYGGTGGSAAAATRALMPGCVSGFASAPAGSPTVATRALGATVPGGPGLTFSP
jgi:hypothetical protein